MSFWSSPLAGEPTNRSFPTVFKSPQAKVVEVDPPTGNTAAWHTKHFLLLSDQELSRESIQSFATTIESVPGLVEGLPLPLSSPIGEKRPIIRLCRDEATFSENGGPDDSAGYYLGRQRGVLIRADLFLTPQRGGNSRIAEPPLEDLLVHELSHLVMADALAWSNPWLSEGLAEYLSIAHQRGGYYRFDQSPRFIRSHIARHLGLNDTSNLSLPSLDHVLNLSSKAWAGAINDAKPEERYLPYATALLFVHYYLEGGSARRSELSTYIEKLKSYHPRHDSKPKLVGEDLTEIEEKLIKFWAHKGIHLRFIDG